MVIKLRCKNEHSFDKQEFEILEQASFLVTCCICGEKLLISNLTEIVIQDYQERVKNNLDNYIKTYGLEGCIELIERNKNCETVKLYIKELQKRGLWLSK